MKRLKKNRFAPLTWFLLVLLTLLATGCAAPQASNGLQQRIDELLKVQEQQAQQLIQLQQQLTELSMQPIEAPEPTAALGPLTQPQSPAILPPQNAPSAAEIASIAEATGLYLEAFAAIATGQMAEAESGFRSFIQRFPDQEYVGNANYWLAEALLSQQKTKRAETVLLNIIDNPKQQNKAPAAMARLINLYRKNGARENASDMLQRLNISYPESPELKRLMWSPEPR